MILRKPTDVNVNKAGDYELVYSVEDSAGNMAKVSRTVKVKEKEVVTKPDGQKPTPNNGGNKEQKAAAAPCLTPPRTNTT